MSPCPWKLSTPLKELDEHLENAHKRVSGVLNYKMGQDRLNLETLSGSARDIFEANLPGQGPLFMRLERSLSSAASYRPKAELSLKELAAEVLEEFHREAVGAFQSLRARLDKEAGAWLLTQNLAEERRRSLLAAAGDALLPPPREEMFREAQGYVAQGLSPGTAAVIGGFAGFGLIIATLRHPVLAGLGVLGGAALGYYLARQRTRRKAVRLLEQLPQDLYNCLRRALSANLSRYEDIVNQSG